MDNFNDLFLYARAAVVNEIVIYLLVAIIVLRVIVVLNNVSHTMPLLRLWGFGGSYIMLAVGAVIVAINTSHSHTVDISDFLFISATVGLIASNRRVQ